jgi:hypothetical protein
MRSAETIADKDAGTEAEVAAPDGGTLRRLKWNEVVSRGDFVADEQQGFAPWSGPSGFRADAFVKPIYRKQAARPAGGKKSS